MWNFSPLSPHLWYLQALLYVLVIAFIVEHLGLRKLAYLAIPVLLAGSLIKGSYSLFFVGKEDCHIYYARKDVYKRQKEEIFRQEGWNYHLEQKEGPLTYNGVCLLYTSRCV